jgi:glycerol-3-phosphate dehydrogenase
VGSTGTDVDVIVIGGGVNGTGVARDCAIRGLSVALFEKNDIGFGASGNSSGMIHGGPRYLTKNPEVTYTSCLDSGHIQKIAPHMLFRVPFLVPVFQKGLGAHIELSTYDAFFEVYDRYQSLKRGKTHLRFSTDEVRELEPGLIRTGGAVSFDEWGIDGVRLCVGNAKDAEERGARIFVHAAVRRIERASDGKVSGVQFVDTESGKSGFISAKIVVNATGAWAPITAALGRLPEGATRLRPGKGIHVFLEKRLSNFAIITQAVDGRQVFLLPWQNMSVLGTTDDDYYGDLDDVVATTGEVRYLREAIARVFPAVRTARAIGTSAGVRPTLYAWGPAPDALSREHEIVDHKKDGLSGLFSMLGGKLASYRLFAEEMSDVVAERLSVRARCQTQVLPLPGGESPAGTSETKAWARKFQMDELSVARLCFRHGARAEQMLEQAPEEQRRIVCPCEPVTELEIRHTVRHEWARSVDDVSRRTRLGLGACGGMRCAVTCGQIVAEERELGPEFGRESARFFHQQALRRRLPAMGPEQARQEALSAAHVYAQTGIALEGDFARHSAPQEPGDEHGGR